MKYKLVVDMTTDRIIWFSSNLNETVFSDDSSSIAFYEGDIPNEMNSNNCWKFRFKNQKIQIDKEPENEELPLLELNRKSLKEFVKKEIYNKRRNNFPASIYDFFIHNSVKKEMESGQPGLWAEVMREAFSEELQKIVLSDSLDLEMYLAKTEKLKIFTMKKLNTALTNEELFDIKSKFLDALEKIK